MTRAALAFTLLGLTTTWRGGWAADPTLPPTEPIVIRRCLLQYERSSTLGAPDRGILQDCLVRPGDRVEANQVVGRLRDGEARAELEIRRAQSANDIELRLAEARFAQMQSKLKATEILFNKKMVSPSEISTHRFEMTIAGLAVEEARHRRRLAELEARRAEALVQSKEIVAPHAGIVLAVHRRPGESVAPNEALFHVVETSRIRVVGSLDVGEIWSVQPGQPVRATLEVGGIDLEVEARTFLGHVTFIDRLVDSKSQTSTIVAEVEDAQGLLRAGLMARMEILPAGVTGALPGPVADTGRPGPAARPAAPRLPVSSEGPR